MCTGGSHTLGLDIINSLIMQNGIELEKCPGATYLNTLQNFGLMATCSRWNHVGFVTGIRTNQPIETLN